MNIYDNQRPVGKIDDFLELRTEFIVIYGTKDLPKDDHASHLDFKIKS